MTGKRAAVRNAVWAGVLLAAIGLAICGHVRDEWQLVLNKAIQICFECIGLG